MSALSLTRDQQRSLYVKGPLFFLYVLPNLEVVVWVGYDGGKVHRGLSLLGARGIPK